MIFVDASLLPILEPIRSKLKSVRHIVVLNDLGSHRLLTPSITRLCSRRRRKDRIRGRSSMKTRRPPCATPPATTGDPKGVVYSHRSLFLHSYGICMADTFALSERDTILQLVPMFHANGWGIPYAGIMTGSRLVFSGRHLQPADIAMLIENERATFSAGVPTLWMTLYRLSRVPSARHLEPSHGGGGGLRAAAPIRRAVREEIRNPLHAGVGHDGNHARSRRSLH